MKLISANVLLLSVLMPTGTVLAQKSVSFVACPVAQDLGPDRDLCFYTMYQGNRYSLENPVDWGEPELLHKVLVEGEVVDRPASCGGLALDGRASVLPELSPECDMIAPALPAEKSKQDEERRRRAKEIADAVAADPALSLVAVPVPDLPYPEVAVGQSETIYYPFDSDRSSGPDAQRLVMLAHLARDTPGARIRIESYRGASLLDNGTLVIEREGMSRQRANKVSEILSGLGAAADAIDIAVTELPEEPSGQKDWKLRRVEVTVFDSD